MWKYVVMLRRGKSGFTITPIPPDARRKGFSYVFVRGNLLCVVRGDRPAKSTLCEAYKLKKALDNRSRPKGGYTYN